MNKRRKRLFSILLIIILFIGGALLLKDRKNGQSAESNGQKKEENTEALLEESQGKTKTNENEDFIYVPTKEEIGYDSDGEILYYENLLNLYLFSEISIEQAEELANTVNGSIVGQLQGAINVLQLQVEEASFDELTQLAKRFEDAELVKFAELSTPAFISDFSANKGQANEKLKDKEKNGDWWIEAINAPAAWDYLDNHDEKFKQVKVAVLESGKLGKKGKDIDDEDIKDIKVTIEDEDAKVSDHAKLVTRIIAAKKDSERIRGVAAGVAKVEFTSIGNNVPIIDEYDNILNEEGEVIPELQIIKIIKESLENDVKVINNSWGFPPYSEEKWQEEFNKWFNTKEREKELSIIPEQYLAMAINANDKISARLIYSLDELLNSEDINPEFLIVQSAGNGYIRAEKEEKSKKHAIDAKLTGSFANINEETYKEAEKLSNNKLNSSLDEILSHVIVVGGAVHKEDGSYESPEWASFGDAIDIAAPAENLFVNEAFGSGTSFSAPMISGAVALIWSYNLELPAYDVKEILLNSAKGNVIDKNKDSDKKVYPMLDMTAFLTAYTCELPSEGHMQRPSKHSDYDALLETYRTAIIEKWDQSELDEKDLGPHPYNPGPLATDYGYEIIDINDDGIHEMILGVTKEGTQLINEIYTLVDDVPDKVFKSGLRYDAKIYENGTIGENASLALAEGVSQHAFYEVCKNESIDNELDENKAKKFKAGYRVNGAKGTYENLANPNRSMKEEDMKILLDKYEKIGVREHSFTPVLQPSSKHDNKPVLKPSSNEYNTLMETYRTAIEENWDQGKLAEFDLGPYSYEPGPLPYDYGYELRDLNNDGIQEMIVGVSLETGKGWINEIYTLKNMKPVKIFEGAIRHSANIYKDGTILESEVTELAEGISEYRYYELDQDGTKKLKDGYKENGAKGTFESLTDPYNSLEKKEINALEGKYNEGELIKHSFKPFAI